MHRHGRAALAVVCAFLCGCGNDTVRPTHKPPPDSPYRNLTEKVHVLHNLELATNQRDVTHYVEVLDPVDFVFFFAPIGGGIPMSWGVAEESQVAQAMFNKGGGRNNNPIIDISLELVDYADALWVEFNNVDYPGWYESIVAYKFTIETESGTRFIASSNSRAQFRVRQDSGGKWRLVQWNDLADTRLSTRISPAGVEPISWGKLKGYYGPSGAR